MGSGQKIIPFLLLALAGGACTARAADYSDPRFPNEYSPVETHVRERSVGALEKREQLLLRQLAALPTPESRVSPPYQNFGYLSGRHPVSATNETMEAWVQLAFFGKWTSSVNGIALVPAYYPDFSSDGNYGFPKRFRIDVFSHAEPDRAVTVVDWTDRDFPDPGLFPVFFSFPPQDVAKVRLTVTRGTVEEDYQFFALDELMVFQKNNNVAPPAYQGLTASGSYEEPPYWKLQFLTNRKLHVGESFHTHKPTADYIQYFDREITESSLPEVWIDLGSVQELGRIEFYPAKKPDLPIPAYAFPLKYQVELKRWLKTRPIVRTGIIEADMPTRMLWTALSSNRGRFIRIILHELPEYNGRPVFAMGEIRVLGNNAGEVKNYALGKTIFTVNFPQENPADTGLLVDGFSNGREIVLERPHIQQLAERKIIEQDLALTRHKLVIARANRKSSFWILGISSAIVLVFSLVLWILYQRVTRERALLNLRQQIAADLHDDISANLGTISMITRRLQQDSSPSLIKEKLLEIGHIAQESFISVKEIIWHMDSNVVHLCEMLERIEKTAITILSDCRVECRFPKPQGIPIPARTRRNIMLLVKEALYNCAKYAEAGHMLIQAEIKESVLVLTMKDDGVGFEAAGDVIAKSDSGRGLANMERRAKLLGAELDVQSKPDEGTRVTLKMPLNRE